MPASSAPRPEVRLREGSDVAFFVELEKGRSLVWTGRAVPGPCALLDRDVDVATSNSLHQKLRERILRELVPLL